MNYSTKERQSQYISNTIIKIKTKDLDFCTSFGDTIPYPQKHYIDNLGHYVYYFVVDGFFSTKNNNVFLKDILKRLLITFDNINIESVKNTNTSYEYYLKLKEFKALKSLSHNIKEYKSNLDNNHDEKFWILKLYAETLISKYGIFSLDELLEYGKFHFKEIQDYKYKCKSIYNYYVENDFTKTYKKVDKTKEQIVASRQEHMIKLNKNKAAEAKRKVVNLTTGLLRNEYKKKNGKWNITKIAEEARVSRDTVYKYLKEI
jgi:hypothetical protein